MRILAPLVLSLLIIWISPIAGAADSGLIRFKQVPTQFIAALGDPAASSGDGAEQWGLWPVDPGPRGVRLRNYELMLADDGIAPARWQFDENDWWLNSNGARFKLG